MITRVLLLPLIGDEKLSGGHAVPVLASRVASVPFCRRSSCQRADEDDHASLAKACGHGSTHECLPVGYRARFGTFGDLCWVRHSGRYALARRVVKEPALQGLPHACVGSYVFVFFVRDGSWRPGAADDRYHANADGVVTNTCHLCPEASMGARISFTASLQPRFLLSCLLVCLLEPNEEFSY